MKRTVSVTATATFDFEIDDEVKSEMDEATIPTVLQKRGKGNDFYTERATMKGLIGDLGIQLCVDNRPISRIDGWADFPDEAASGSHFAVNWDIEEVRVNGDLVKT